MKEPLGINPSKGNQGTTRGKEKILLTSVGIEPTTSGLDLPEVVGSILTEVKIFFSLPRVVSRFPLLGLTPSGSFMDFT